MTRKDPVVPAKKRTHEGLPFPWTATPSPCVCDGACVPASEVCESCPATSSSHPIRPQIHGRRTWLQGQQATLRPHLLLSWVGKDRAPWVNWRQDPSTAALKLLRKASPCNTAYGNSITSLGRIWNNPTCKQKSTLAQRGRRKRGKRPGCSSDSLTRPSSVRMN